MRARPVVLALCVGCLALAAGLPAQDRPTPPAVSAADFVVPGSVTPLPVPVASGVDRIRTTNVSAHLAFLAAPALEGRGLGRVGLEAARNYVAASLSLAGIAPLAQGESPSAYFQPVPLREITHAAGQLTIETHAQPQTGSRTFSSGVDCLFPEIAPQVITAPVVFAGYGIRDPALGRDDYRNLEVRGKIVVVVAGLPAGAAWQKPELVARFAAPEGRARYAAKAQAAASLGARALIAVETAGFDARLAAARPAAAYFLSADDVPSAELPVVVASPAVAAAVFAADAAGESLESAAPRAVSDVVATIRVSGDERRFLAHNVVGVIPGSDAARRAEAVVIGAHMDHLGRSGDTIFPGADDNASGVAALIEIAKAYAASSTKPRRSLVFVFWTGEEEGHLGSEFYVRHPLWPLERTALYANLDMIGHPWTAEEMRKLVVETGVPQAAELLARVKPADFVEPGVARWAPELHPLLERAARGLGLALHFDRTDGKSGGSDYRAFARRDVPFIRFFGNYFPGYHEPTDTVASLDAAQVRKMAALAFATTWLAADR